MQTLSPQQTEQASGGIPWGAPAFAAILDSAALGPLVFSFGAGYAVGTWLYQNVISE